MVVRVKRAEIPIPSVTWHIDVRESDTGVIKVNLIAASTPDEIITAIEDLKSRNALKFVLDLRDNPGGLLTAGVDIARLFLENGIVMMQEYRHKDTEVYEVQKPGQFVDLPLIVLINQHSASAAEITAGALQGHKRAKLVGVPSFGKDTVQFVLVLSDNSSLHVTAARWWIPSLNSDLKSLQPDILVEPTSEEPYDEILRTAVNKLH
jgi:carboxyl-terminal processing protease